MPPLLTSVSYPVGNPLTRTHMLTEHTDAHMPSPQPGRCAAEARASPPGALPLQAGRHAPGRPVLGIRRRAAGRSGRAHARAHHGRSRGACLALTCLRGPGAALHPRHAAAVLRRAAICLRLARRRRIAGAGRAPACGIAERGRQRVGRVSRRVAGARASARRARALTGQRVLRAHRTGRVRTDSHPDPPTPPAGQEHMSNTAAITPFARLQDRVRSQGVPWSATGTPRHAAQSGRGQPSGARNAARQPPQPLLRPPTCAARGPGRRALARMCDSMRSTMRQCSRSPSVSRFCTAGGAGARAASPPPAPASCSAAAPARRVRALGAAAARGREPAVSGRATKQGAVQGRLDCAKVAADMRQAQPLALYAHASLPVCRLQVCRAERRGPWRPRWVAAASALPSNTGRRAGGAVPRRPGRTLEHRVQVGLHGPECLPHVVQAPALRGAPAALTASHRRKALQQPHAAPQAAGPLRAPPAHTAYTDLQGDTEAAGHK